MYGKMMDVPLTITSIMQHAKKLNRHVEIVSVTHDHDYHKETFSQAFERSAQLAHAFDAHGIAKSDRIGTLAWNDFRHFELYFAISSYGAVCHTINPRLHPEQIQFIINDAQDKLLFVDPMFLPLIAAIIDHIPTVEKIIVLDGGQTETPFTAKPCDNYESFIQDQSVDYTWPELSEYDACSLCYTSGTTGNPKGVLYHHRAIVLHSMAVAMPDAFGISRADVLLPVVPMFHVNAWGLPYVAAMTGTKLVFAGAKVGSGEVLTNLMNSEKVTVSAGVPTVWRALMDHLKTNELTIPTLTRMVVGGAACPEYIIKYFDEAQDVKIIHAWGMTEMSPLGTINNNLPSSCDDWTTEQKRQQYLKQGYPIYGVDIELEAPDGTNAPWDGETTGEIKVRGPWICDGYYNIEQSGGDWFYTGDVANIDKHGYMKIVDRIKDVIKSGGEWISSVEVENFAAAHPDVQQAAVIGIAHPKWDERPLLILVPEPGKTPDKATMDNWLQDKIAKWWLPDAVELVESLPLTATGKVSKLKLREQFSNFTF